MFLQFSSLLKFPGAAGNTVSRFVSMLTGSEVFVPETAIAHRLPLMIEVQWSNITAYQFSNDEPQNIAPRQYRFDRVRCRSRKAGQGKFMWATVRGPSQTARFSRQGPFAISLNSIRRQTLITTNHLFQAAIAAFTTW